MSVRTEYAPGTPSWTDVMTPDIAASKEFYGSLFGWSFDERDTGAPDMPYVMIQQDGKAVAGMMALTPEMAAGGMPPVWSTYVTVTDVDASTAKVAGLGGTVLNGPMDVMDAGRMTVVSDPTGAVICLWQPKESIGAELVNEPVSMTWNELLTSDVAKVKPFYEGLFGWKAEDVEMAGGPTYTVWNLPGSEPGMGGAVKSPMEGMPSFWNVYFQVDDVDATVAKAKELGASVLAEPMDIPDVGRMAGLVDPQGAAFSILKSSNPQP
jgi:predicted enzyme related to lactoylglutathione lyase